MVNQNVSVDVQPPRLGQEQRKSAAQRKRDEEGVAQMQEDPQLPSASREGEHEVERRRCGERREADVQPPPAFVAAHGVRQPGEVPREHDATQRNERRPQRGALASPQDEDEQEQPPRASENGDHAASDHSRGG